MAIRLNLACKSDWPCPFYDMQQEMAAHWPSSLSRSWAVLGMLLHSFISSTLGMIKPVLSSLSRAIWSRQAKSPAHEIDLKQLSCARPDARLAEWVCGNEIYRDTQGNQCIERSWQE